MKYDLVVVGGGIVGLATAWEFLKKHANARILVLEKEARVCFHQSGRNSGVLHSGIYYKPGSLKAKNCREGKALMERFCREENIAFETCGKVIVAVDKTEVHAMNLLFERGIANGVACRKIDRNELKVIEPHVNGVAAIHVEEAGIVDYLGVCERLVSKIMEQGSSVRTGVCVTGLSEQSDRVVVKAESDQFEAKRVVNCAGLYSDRMVALTGKKPSAEIIPFRGEYFELKESAEGLCNHLIYPVPDIRFPFLGVHFTRMVTGGVECGPNAVLALAREGYDWETVNGKEIGWMLRNPSFWQMGAKFWRPGLDEVMRSLSKDRFVEALQRLIPDIRKEDLVRAPAGVRAQALGKGGRLVDDFVIQKEGRICHVCNAPSPAATSAFRIGQTVVESI